MRLVARSFACLGLLCAGYALGSLQMGAPSFLHAEPQTDALPAAVRGRVSETDRAISDTMMMLQEEKRYVPAISAINAFATSVGGLDAVADLESGQGVDPETFAGLYAGEAVPEVREHLSRDAEGRMTYKNKVVRMYNASRLKQLFAARANFAPASAAGSKSASDAPKKGKDEAAGTEKSKDE